MEVEVEVVVVLLLLVAMVLLVVVVAVLVVLCRVAMGHTSRFSELIAEQSKGSLLLD